MPPYSYKLLDNPSDPLLPSYSDDHPDVEKASSTMATPEKVQPGYGQGAFDESDVPLRIGSRSRSRSAQIKGKWAGLSAVKKCLMVIALAWAAVGLMRLGKGGMRRCRSWGWGRGNGRWDIPSEVCLSLLSCHQRFEVESAVHADRSTARVRSRRL